jgi:hypothetical protein
MHEDAILMVVSGDIGSRFRGRCILEQADGKQALELDEEVPFERRFQGLGLRCQLDTMGRVQVTLQMRRTISQSASNGGRVSVSVR